MKRKVSQWFCMAVSTLLVGGALILAGCETGSSSTTVRNMSLQIAGLYKNPSGRLVANNTGAAVQQLNVMQMGDQLTGMDNNGIVFQGHLSGESGNHGNVTLKGRTTAGTEATISGQIFVTGNKAVMQGTWIESSLYSTVYGEASVIGVVTNTVLPPSTNQASLYRSPEF